MLSFHFRFLRLFSNLPKKLKFRALTVLILSVIGGGLEIISVGAVIPFLTVMLGDEQNYVTAYSLNEMLGADPNDLKIILALIVLVFAVRGIFLIGLSFTVSKLAYSIRFYMTKRIANHLLNMKFEDFLQKTSSEFIQIPSVESRLVTANVILPTLVVLTEAILAITLFALLIFYDWLMLLATFGVFSIFSIVYLLLMSRRLQIFGRDRQIHETYSLNILGDAFRGFRELNIFGAKQIFMDKYANSLFKVTRSEYLIYAFSLVPRYGLEFIALFSLCGAVYILMFLGVSQQDIFMSVGVFGVVALKILPSGSRILASLSKIRYNLEPFCNFEEYFNESSLEFRCHSQERRVEEGVDLKLNFNDVSYSHSGEVRKILDNFSYSFERGKIYGLSGVSGSGKTTFVHLALGLLMPQQGDIKINDRDASNMASMYKNLFSLISQDLFIFSGSLVENVTFSNLDYDHEKYQQSLKQSGVGDKLINNINNNSHRNLVSSLSGGEQQRINLARVLYSDASIRVLDEPDSALDDANLERLMEAIKSTKKNKITFIVSHKSSVLAGCDEIINFPLGGSFES